jgi:hypothetical protein
LCRDVYCARGYCGASHGFETLAVITDIGDEDNIDSISHDEVLKLLKMQAKC